MGTRKDFAEVMRLVFAGKLSPVLDRSFSLAEARAAEEKLEAGEQMGKIVLEV
jgi:NADPH:quinone reductase-like Zn-dependent oxidoreductase